VRRVKQQRTEPRFAAIDLTIAATMFGLLSSGGLPFHATVLAIIRWKNRMT
jgi:hypothetical protein